MGSYTAYTPVEAAIWSSALGVQDAIATYLHGVVGVLVLLGVSFSLFHYAKGLVGDGDLTRLTGPFLTRLLIITVGLTFLGVNAGSFQATSPKGSSWSSFGALKNEAEFAPIFQDHSGMTFYKLMHGALVEISAKLTSLVGDATGKPWDASPEGAFRSMAMAARAQFDDPELLRSLSDLDTHCPKTTNQPVVDLKTGLSAFWDLSTPECETRHRLYKTQLEGWAKKQTGAIDSAYYAFCGLKFNPLCDQENLKGMFIANAAKNYAMKSFDTTLGLHEDALTIRKAAKGEDDPYYQNAGRSLALDRLFSLKSLVAAVTDRDFNTMSVNEMRNPAAEKYNDYLHLLPALRGYMLGFCAIAFVFSALFMCIGRLSAIISWCVMAATLSLYPFLSACAFAGAASFMDMTRVSELNPNLTADPTMVGLAAALTEQVSSMSTVYFILQCVIMTFCSVGVFQQILGFTNKSDLLLKGVQKVTKVVSTAATVL